MQRNRSHSRSTTGVPEQPSDQAAQPRGHLHGAHWSTLWLPSLLLGRQAPSKAGLGMMEAPSGLDAHVLHAASPPGFNKGHELVGVERPICSTRDFFRWGPNGGWANGPSARDLHDAGVAHLLHLGVHLALGHTVRTKEVLPSVEAGNLHRNSLSTPRSECTAARLWHESNLCRGLVVVQDTPSCGRSGDHSPLGACQGGHPDAWVSPQKLSRLPLHVRPVHRGQRQKRSMAGGLEPKCQVHQPSI